jgi:hypothetical protein
VKDSRVRKSLQEFLIENKSFDKDTLEKIFNLARIEVLDSIKQDFIKWITVIGFIITILGVIGANTLIQNTVQDRVRTTLDSFKDEIQKTQVAVQTTAGQIGQVQTAISDKAKELINLEAELEQQIAKGSELTTIMQRGLKEYFQIRTLTASGHIFFYDGFDNAYSKSFRGIRVPGQGQDSPDLASLGGSFVSTIFDIRMILGKQSDPQYSIPLGMIFFSNDRDTILAKCSPDVAVLEELNAKNISFLDNLDEITLIASPQILSSDMQKVFSSSNKNFVKELDILRPAILAFYQAIGNIDIDISVNGTRIWSYGVQKPFSGLDDQSIREGSLRVPLTVTSPVGDVKQAYEQADANQKAQDQGPRSLLKRR